MKFALLRALLVGVAKAILVALLLAAAAYLHGDPNMEALLLWIAVPYGLMAAFIGYVSHPLAKPLPLWIRDNRWSRRFVVGVSMGTLIAWPIFVAAWILGFILLSYVRDTGYLATSRDPLDAVCSFASYSSWVSAFAGSLLSALIAPLAFKDRPLAMRSYWTGIAGAILGAWLGAGTALAYFFVRDRLQFYWDDFAASLAASIAGVIAGIAAALIGRWRGLRLP